MALQSHNTACYPALLDVSAAANTNLFSDAQWRALAQLSLRSGLAVEHLLNSLRVEFVNAQESDAVRLVGMLRLGPTYQLFGCIDTDGSINT